MKRARPIVTSTTMNCMPSNSPTDPSHCAPPPFSLLLSNPTPPSDSLFLSNRGPVPNSFPPSGTATNTTFPLPASIADHPAFIPDDFFNFAPSNSAPFLDPHSLATTDFGAAFFSSISNDDPTHLDPLDPPIVHNPLTSEVDGADTPESAPTVARRVPRAPPEARRAPGTRGQVATKDEFVIQHVELDRDLVGPDGKQKQDHNSLVWTLLPPSISPSWLIKSDWEASLTAALDETGANLRPNDKKAVLEALVKPWDVGVDLKTDKLKGLVHLARFRALCIGFKARVGDTEVPLLEHTLKPKKICVYAVDDRVFVGTSAKLFPLSRNHGDELIKLSLVHHPPTVSDMTEFPLVANPMAVKMRWTGLAAPTPDSGDAASAIRVQGGNCKPGTGGGQSQSRWFLRVAAEEECQLPPPGKRRRTAADAKVEPAFMPSDAPAIGSPSLPLPVPDTDTPHPVMPITPDKAIGGGAPSADSHALPLHVPETYTPHPVMPITPDKFIWASTPIAFSDGLLHGIRESDGVVMPRPVRPPGKEGTQLDALDDPVFVAAIDCLSDDTASTVTCSPSPSSRASSAALPGGNHTHPTAPYVGAKIGMWCTA